MRRRGQVVIQEKAKHVDGATLAQAFRGEL